MKSTKNFYSYNLKYIQNNLFTAAKTQNSELQSHKLNETATF